MMTPSAGRPRAAIVGAYEHPHRRMPADTSALQVKAECAAKALREAGLGWADVDALYDAGEAIDGPGLSIAEYFGIRPSILNTTATGGSSFEFHVASAVEAISLGRARVALLTYGSVARSSNRSIGTELRASATPNPMRSLEGPYGATTVASYAFAANRHMHQFGTTSEQLAEIPVTARRHALRNPEAVTGLRSIGIDPKRLTVEDVISSRLVSDPLHLLDCCLITDGGGAIVLVAPELVADMGSKPVWVLGCGTGNTYSSCYGDDITVTAAAISGPPAFGEAGVGPEDIDIAMIYDSFSYTVLACLEDLGFCDKGEGGAYVEGGRLNFDTPGGPALNTDGGGLSSTHPGMRGIFLLIEATRQLRAESTSQVPGAQLAVAHGNGGRLGSRSAAATVILGAA